MAEGGGTVITLYDNELSGNGYKVRLFLHLLERPYTRKTVALLLNCPKPVLQGMRDDWRAAPGERS